MFCTSLDFLVQQRPPRTCTDWKSASVLSPVPNDIKADFSLFINTNYLSLQRQCEAHTGRTLCLFCFLKLIMNRPVHSEHKLVWSLEGWFPAGPEKVFFYFFFFWRKLWCHQRTHHVEDCENVNVPTLRLHLDLKIACKVLYAHHIRNDPTICWFKQNINVWLTLCCCWFVRISTNLANLW